MEFVIAAHALKIKLFGLYLCAGRHGGYLACGPQRGRLRERGEHIGAVKLELHF